MNFESYRPYMTAENMMGPNNARILKELLEKHPLQLSADQTILDLGCGKGLTSLMLANETGAKVCASDLWIAEEENKKRFETWGVGEQITAAHEDANHLTFAPKMFDALVSVDAYHYFGTGHGFFEEKILPFLKDGATVLIGVPGIKNEYTGRSEELLADWLGDEAYMFQSPLKWKEIIGQNERIKTVETWEMECFQLAWDEWFATGHKYAQGDQGFFETLIKPYTCFAGICIELK